MRQGGDVLLSRGSGDAAKAEQKMRSAVIILLALSACRGYSEPTDELLDRVEAIPPLPGPYLRVEADLDVESPWLSGRFNIVAIGRTGVDPRVRAQLFPDIGGKAVDLVAFPGRVIGTLPQAGQAVDSDLKTEKDLHPLHFMGITLLEHFASGITNRVIGARPAEGWLLLKPLAGRGEVQVKLDENDRIVRRIFTWHTTWEEEIGPDEVTIRTKGVTIRLTNIRRKPLESVPDSIFTPPGRP